jgi:hypothetical protein
MILGLSGSISTIGNYYVFFLFFAVIVEIDRMNCTSRKIAIIFKSTFVIVTSCMIVFKMFEMRGVHLGARIFLKLKSMYI